MQGSADAAVVWTNIYNGKTRVFGTTLGHNNQTVADPRFLDLVTDENLRERIAVQTEPTRNLILALAFGAQSLIKDFFSGFMILLEQQYMVNDVVKIEDVTGQVERITLRMTVLRDLEGHVHFIPHGTINRVSNSC